MKKLLAIPFVLMLVFTSCHKKEAEVSKFPVTVNQGNNKVKLSWSPITFSDFKNVAIYRSSSPIPDPGFGKTVDATLQIGLISDKTVTSFTDSNMVMNTTGTSYYKVVVTFGNRFIVSDLITVVRNGFSMVMSTINSSATLIRFSEIHTLYYVDYSFGTIRAVNYLTKTVSNSISFLSNNTQFVTAVNNGNPELFLIVNNYNVYCYNANTLALKYTFTMNSNYYLYTCCIKNNFLYAYTGSYLFTYNLATKTLVNTKTINEGISTYTTKLFSGPGNTLFFRYYVQNYNSSNGQYSYMNKVRIYSLPGGIPTDSTIIPPMIINTDTMNQGNNNYSYINLSPDGKYLSLNFNGDVYALQDHSVHNVITNSSFLGISFSQDGQYLVTRPNNQQSTGYSVGVFSLPSFSLVNTMRSGKLGSTNISDDFTTNDTLVSYNLTNLFVNNQFQSVLNVSFNKID
jgi:hypothetical protein